MVVLKNCESEPSYILAELFNKFLKESCFSDCLKVSLVVPEFKNIGQRSTVFTTILLVLFLWLVKSYRIVGHPEKCGRFYDFQYDFRSINCKSSCSCI